MVSDKNEWINELIYNSYRDLLLQTLLKNLYSFFSIHMPLSYLTLYRYQDGTITKIAMYSNYKGLFSSPDVVCIPDDIMQALHMDTTNSGTWYQTRICSESAGYPYSKVSKMLHPNPGTSIFVPLDYFINYGELRYLSVFSLGECSYTQDHVELCDAVRKPLGAAVRDILLMGNRRKGNTGSMTAIPISPMKARVSRRPFAAWMSILRTISARSSSTLTGASAAKTARPPFWACRPPRSGQKCANSRSAAVSKPGAE